MSKPKIRDLDLKIHLNDLVEGWQSQASMMLKYGCDLADATRDTDQAKAQLAVMAGQIEREIRQNPAIFGLGKPTEAAVAATVCDQPRHKQATEKHRDAKHLEALTKAAVNAISHRKSTLQGLTDLWLRQYHADPTTKAQPEELRDAADNHTKIIKRGKGGRVGKRKKQT